MPAVPSLRYLPGTKTPHMNVDASLRPLYTTCPLILQPPPQPAVPDCFPPPALLATFCAAFVTQLFSPTIEPVHANLPPLGHYIKRVLRRADLPPAVPFSALVLLGRLYVRQPDAHNVNLHRLFITMLMVASKVLCDNVYDLDTWEKIAYGVAKKKELGLMEWHILNHLDYDVIVNWAEIKNILTPLNAPAPPVTHIIENGYPTPPPSPIAFGTVHPWNN